MTTRAFIAAVEHYPLTKSTSRQLPGTIAAAERFATWLRDGIKVDPKKITFCSSGPSAFKTHETTTPAISEAILDLVKAGRDDPDGTEILFVFLAGHGVMIPKASFDADVLLCSDFIEPRISGKACIEVNELTELFACNLGVGTHLWFIDACRTTATDLDATRLGITPAKSETGKAGWFQLLSAFAGQAAINDALFIDALLNALNGNCDLVKDESEAGHFWVTFQNVADSVGKAFAAQDREQFVRSASRLPDVRIARTRRASQTDTMVVDERGKKLPPVELLTEFDEIVFLGETNGQLPKFVREAFADRQNRKWKRIELLSIEDLSHAFRGDAAVQDLEAERHASEDFFRNEAVMMADEIVLYRYDYVGTYGSFWKSNDGKRRARQRGARR